MANRCGMSPTNNCGINSIMQPITRKPDPTTKVSKGRYAFVSLGCPKNLVDSERILGQLQLDGYQLVEDPVGTDFVVVNTCGFIEQAREESFAAIDEMLELKRKGDTRGVVVCGCLAERQREQLYEDRPDIDSLVGVFARDEVTRIANRLVGDLDEQRNVFHPAPIRALPDTERFRITPRHFAYMKISEGCDRLCTFCAIPQMRGKHASKPIADILAEARQLADDGVRELIVVAQDTTYYGMDLYGEPRLKELLLELDKVDGLDWIRLMYFYPMYIDKPLLEVIANSQRIVPYIDMPLQHISDSMLRTMSRRVDRAKTEDVLQLLRDSIPGLTLRSTLITGFPGESEEDFLELKEFVKQQKFDHLGVFTYSFEGSTPSAKLPGHLSEQTKAERRDAIMAIQQEIAFARAARRVGEQLDVIIDQPLGTGANAWIGRSAGDAPDVDAVVYVTGESHPISTGHVVKCEVVDSQEYDLVGCAISDPR
jgi:ribosomal protein S12 methylthiotransferase